MELLIKHFLRSGEVRRATRKNILKRGRKDLEIGLRSSLRIVHYTSNKRTKSFITREAFKRSPGLIIRSGVWYRLNRWRDDQITKGRPITYGNLVTEFIRLNQPGVKFKKGKSGRYINFLSEFLAKEKGSRIQALKEWRRLKAMPVEKTYRAWKVSRKDAKSQIGRRV